MNSISHFISILLTIGSFLGLPYIPLSTQNSSSVSVSTSTRKAASSTPATNVKKPVPKTIATITSLPNRKLPTLVLQAPSFKFISPSSTTNLTPPVIVPPSNTVAPSPTSTIQTSPPVVIPPPPLITPVTGIPLVQKSVVNVYCTSQSGNTITIVTGSGIVIDPRGVILTNAHVADQVLLRDYLHNSANECFIRSGSPAVATYHVALVYIAPAWLAEHGKEINSPIQAQETGESDYALLVATDALNYQSLPVFSYLNINLNPNLDSSIPLIASGYPAGGLTGQAVIKSLLQKTDTPTLKAQYSFHGGSADLIGTTGTIIASRGSSGGAITDSGGQLMGLIATTIPDSVNPSIEDLQGLTLSYINRDLQNKTGFDIKSFLNQDLVALAANFKQSTEPSLFNYLPH